MKLGGASAGARCIADLAFSRGTGHVVATRLAERESLLGPATPLACLSVPVRPRVSYLGTSRPICTVVANTTFNAQGKVANVGHVQLQPTSDERTRFGLAAAYGHSPQTKGDWSARISMQGTLPDGRSFVMQGVKSDAKRLDTDTPLPAEQVSRVIDHGAMSADQAMRLKSAVETAPQVYETSGLERANCVHVYGAVARQVFGISLPELHPHELPQGVARQVERALESTLKPASERTPEANSQ